MANPTTNFGWVMPTSASLVTNLPADFNVFGQAVDTSMQYLLGGTTGQVLSKTSGTNMAFTWVTAQVGDITGVAAGTGLSGGGTSGDVTLSINTAVTADLTTAQTLTNKKLSDSTTTIVDVTDATKAIKFDVAGTTGITGTIATAFTTGKTVTIPDTTGTVALTNGVVNNTLTTTTGDIIYASAANTPARLGIGSSAQVLTVASGIPSWATPAASSFNTGYAFTSVGEATTSTSYTNLTTTTSVTVTTGTKALVSIAANIETVASGEPYVSFAVSGATTVAASDDYSGFCFNSAASMQVTSGRAIVLTGLTAGSNTFTLKYKSVGGQSITFRRRGISIVDLGS